MLNILKSRFLPIFVAALGVVLTLPSLTVGLVLDDYVQMVGFQPEREEDSESSTPFMRSMREAIGEPRGMFDFLRGDPDQTKKLIRLGVAPWWTDPALRIAFWRPVTSLSHHFDYALWPDNPAFMHCQNLLWFGGLAAVVALLFRGVMGAGTASGLAAILYTVDDARVLPASWVANRNALIATFFGVMCLLFHHRWRQRKGGLLSAVLALGFLALAFGAGEMAVATGAYLLAYAIFMDESKGWRRLSSLLPYAILGCVWILHHRLAGYGSAHSGFYIDPGREPIRFLQAVLDRAPLLFLSQWLGPSADLNTLLSETALNGLRIVSAGFLVAWAWLFFPVLKKEKTARFWAMGMLLSFIPICSVIPSDRMLLFTGIGAMGLMATFLASLKEADPPLSDNRPWKVAAKISFWTFILIHGILAPPVLFIRSSLDLRAAESIVSGPSASLASEESLQQKTVILVNAPGSIISTYIPFRRIYDGSPPPARTILLAPGIYPMEVERPDKKSLILRTQESFLEEPGSGIANDAPIAPECLFQNFSFLYRHPNARMETGATIDAGVATVTITEISEEGRPREVRFDFQKPLEDESYSWKRWDQGELFPFLLPEVGETLSLSPVRIPLAPPPQQS